MDNLGPQPQRDIEDEIRVVFDHRSRRWQLTMLGLLVQDLQLQNWRHPARASQGFESGAGGEGDMINWTQIHNFKRSEFMQPELLRWDMIKKLDDLREAVGFPLRITSSYRDPGHNAVVGGVLDSSHCPGPDGYYSGVDLSIEGIGGHSLFTLIREAYALGFVRIGIYPRHIHLDIESRLPQMVMWVGKD